VIAQIAALVLIAATAVLNGQTPKRQARVGSIRSLHAPPDRGGPSHIGVSASSCGPRPFRTKMQDRSDIAQWPFKRIPRQPGGTRSASFDDFDIVRLRRRRITIDWASMGDRSRPQNAAFGIDPAITGCGTEPPRSSPWSALVFR
jgi:hypothetical protein